MPQRYRLTDPQHAMLADSLTSPGSGLWNVQLIFTIREPLELGRFRAAWQQLAQRHTALRTRFLLQGDSEPLQVVEHRVEVQIEHLDWSNLDGVEIERRVETLRRALVVQDLDFAVPPVMRVVLVQARPDLHFCIWVGHHALVDGRSMYNVAHDLGALYHGGDDASLPAARPYREYVDWLASYAPDGAEPFWSGHLAGVTRATTLGWSGREPPGSLGSVALRLSGEQTARLEAFCRQHGVTANALVQSAWALLLARYGDSDEVVFGSTRNCRRSALAGAGGVDAMVGQFVHAVPVRVRLAPALTVIELAREVQRQHLAVRPYEHTSPLAIRQASGLPAGSRLFETVVTFEHRSIPSTLESLGGFWGRWDVLDRGRNGYAVTLFAYDEPELLLRLEWHGGWLADPVASRMLPNLAHTLQSMVEHGDRAVRDLDCLTPGERALVVDEWNRTEVAFTAGATLHGLLEEQARKTPTRPAVRLDERVLTYAELDRQASQLAAALAARGVGRGSLVGICLERSPELVTSLLATLRAGAAYVPVDPEHPADRIRFVLEDSRARVLITTRLLSERLPPLTPERLLLPEALQGARSAPPAAAVEESDPAYVLYTSGSTGKPKGAINTHRAIVNRLRWMQETYRLTDRDRVLQKTPFSFDVSIWELFWPLMNGAELVLARPGGHREAEYLAQLIRDAGITVTHFVPSMLREFLQAPSARDCRSLRLVISSGEVLPLDVHDQFLELFEARLDNLYGPTEAAVDVTWWRCRRAPDQTTVPIGRPVANTRIYVLDRQRRPVPAGMPGELYIGGVQVAQGYLNRPELTAERFVPDPFATDDGARLFRTGDLARYREDGALVFLGRTDAQVKIRGLRVELEEIEAALRGHESVRDAAVVVGDSDRLTAFLVFGGLAVPTTSDLRRFLKQWLPDYMIPGLIVEVAQLPRLPNGKLDRHALRELAAPSRRTPGAQRGLSTAMERVVASVWSALLRSSHVEPGDNFYELGGDSMLAVRAVIALEEKLGQRMDPRLMFFQTLEQIAAGLETAVGATT